MGRPKETGWSILVGTSFATGSSQGIASNLWTEREERAQSDAPAVMAPDLHAQASALGQYVPALRTAVRSRCADAGRTLVRNNPKSHTAATPGTTEQHHHRDLQDWR